MHSFNALQAGDVYSKQYGGVQGFYTSTEAQTAFDNRLKHVLEHVHTTLNKPWKELSDYIFAFEAENEAMIGIVRTSFDCSKRRSQYFAGRKLYRVSHGLVNFGSLLIWYVRLNQVAQAV